MVYNVSQTSNEITMRSKTCKQCGTTFEYEYYVGHRVPLYCSRKCSRVGERYERHRDAAMRRLIREMGVPGMIGYNYETGVVIIE